jgi:hypothetical protein
VALLEKGADPNVPDKSGMTALYAAVDMNTIQTVWGRPMPLLEDAVDPVAMVRSLLAHRANPNLQLKRPSSAGTRGTRAMPRSARARRRWRVRPRAATPDDESAARGRRQSAPHAWPI